MREAAENELLKPAMATDDDDDDERGAGLMIDLLHNEVRRKVFSGSLECA